MHPKIVPNLFKPILLILNIKHNILIIKETLCMFVTHCILQFDVFNYADVSLWITTQHFLIYIFKYTHKTKCISAFLFQTCQFFWLCNPSCWLNRFFSKPFMLVNHKLRNCISYKHLLILLKYKMSVLRAYFFLFLDSLATQSHSFIKTEK